MNCGGQFEEKNCGALLRQNAIKSNDQINSSRENGSIPNRSLSDQSTLGTT